MAKKYIVLCLGTKINGIKSFIKCIRKIVIIELSLGVELKASKFKSSMPLKQLHDYVDYEEKSNVFKNSNESGGQEVKTVI